MSVRVGILGVGVMGADHARILVSQVRGARLRALYDADAVRARTVADQLGAETVASDALALIEDPSVDAVLIASPDNTHKQLALACIAARKPVLCEKPLAPTTAECLEVIADEVRLGRRLVQIGYMRRFDPAYAELKAKLLAGHLGKPLMFHCFHRNVAAPAWFDSKMAISNSAVHEFDAARWVLDAELTAIQAFRPSVASGNSSGQPVFLVLQASQGELVNVEIVNNAAYGYDVRAELVCERGTISLRSPVRTETSSDLTRGIDYPADWRPRFADAYRLQAQAWINAVLSETSTGASTWDGYRAAVVAEAGLQSLDIGGRAVIPPSDKPTLYDEPR